MILHRAKYNGFGMKQIEGTLQVFNEFFKKEKFDTVIEIGTVPGGFALFLADKSKEFGFRFITIDIREPNKKILLLIRKSNGFFVNEDALHSNIIIKNLYMQNNRVLILNDGGLKEPIFAKYIGMLKRNDFLLTHDYYPWINETVDKDSGGISMLTVKDLIDKFNIEVKYEKLFDKFLWLCCRKR
uniref:Putative cephalosporin hydroxylase n=1 Tax=viral metagenome TaxID=1070528 RepID=A0A6M3J1K3_9ZZZZ